MKSPVEALCLAPSFTCRCQHIFESSTQTNNENHCLSVSKWYLVKVKLNSSQTHIGLFQGLNSNFPTSIPDLFTWANFTDTLQFLYPLLFSYLFLQLPF